MLNELKNAVNNGFNGFEGGPIDARSRQFYLEWLENRYSHMTEEEANEALKKEYAHWEVLKNRLAEELSRGFSMVRIANETRLDIKHLEAWATDFIHFRIARRIGDESQASMIEKALEARFKEIDLERATEKRREPARIETSVTCEAIAATARAREFTSMVDFSAPSGSGKSQGTEEYLARARKTEGFECAVWKITLKPSHTTVKGLLELIARECIGNSYDIRNESRMFDEIMSATQGRGGVLIIDEAQQMADTNNGIAMINILRSFVDARAFGIILMGNNEIYKRLKRENAFQILGRMNPWRVELKGASEGDIDQLILAWSVSGKAERALCHKIARGNGGLHNLINSFRVALSIYGVIDAETLDMVSKG